LSWQKTTTYAIYWFSCLQSYKGILSNKSIFFKSFFFITKQQECMKIKVNFKSFMLLALFTVLSNIAFAQRTVSGVVKDADTGESLVGSSVVVTGTTKGTLTDLDGKYELSIPADAASLTFSYTGYASLTIALGASKVVDANLKGGSILEAYVVQGYGSVKKKDATGAVNTITEKDFNRGVINSPEQLMQGRVAGVQVSQSSGEPGGGINVRIRGTSSVRSGNNPLFVVDGVPLSGEETSAGGGNTSIGGSTAKNPLNFLNPDDIASIDVLKDASATAIYGSRGANGVVLITTKSGKSGKGTLDYGYSYGSSNITKRYDLLSPTEFVAAAGASKNLGGSTDWQNELFRSAATHQHNLSFGAGDAAGAYRFSLGYLNQDGIVLNSNVKRYNARFNADRKFLDNKLKIGVQATIANNLDQGVPISDNGGFEGDLLGAILKSNPTMPVYKAGTDTVTQLSTAEPNPMAYIVHSKDLTKTLRTLGNISAEYQIMDGLSFKTVLGFDRSNSGRKTAYSPLLRVAGLYGNGRLINQDITVNNSLLESYLTYGKQFGSIGLNAMAGYSYSRFDRLSNGMVTVGFRENDLNLIMNNAASVDAKAGKYAPFNSYNTVDELQSYFGRLNFNISEKYLITATLRADGSTKFGPGKQYGYFPSFAAKWRLIEESFIPKNIFSDLGIRAGYGVTGNQEIPHNLYDSRNRYDNWSIDNDKNVNGGGFNNVSFNNPNLQWETTSATNLGIDFGFANNRVSGSIEVYNKNTSKLLIQVTSAQPALSPFVWKNLDAIVNNKGVELSLNVVAVSTKDFRWDISGNIANNKNVVKNFTGLINTGEINGQGLTGAFAQRIAQDQPLFAFFLRDFGGFDKDGNSLYPAGDFQQFLAGGGGGLSKSPLPTITGAFSSNIKYKDFDLGFMFNGVAGNYIYSNTENAYFTAGALSNGRNVIKSVVGNGEGGLNAPDVSTRFLQSGSFLRFQNLSLGYNVKLNSTKVNSLRVYVTGQNLATFTSYTGQDPEVSTNKAINGVPSFGIDYTAYPRARTWTVGANISF
jgi:TonB-dependent starch-binding outer membrane protein SusC